MRKGRLVKEGAGIATGSGSLSKISFSDRTAIGADKTEAARARATNITRTEEYILINEEENI